MGYGELQEGLVHATMVYAEIDHLHYQLKL